MNWISVESAALLVSILALAVKVFFGLRKRSLALRSFSEAGAEIEVRQMAPVYIGQPEYAFNIVNHGRMTASIQQIGVAVTHRGVLTQAVYAPPNFYPHALDCYDNLSLAFPYDTILQLKSRLPKGRVRVFVHTSHDAFVGPVIPVPGIANWSRALFYRWKIRRISVHSRP